MSNIKDISFQNANHAKLITTTSDAPTDEILRSLEIKPPRALILILGGASGLDESLKPRLLALFSRSIARAASETGAVIIDGGTKAGVMEIMGQAVADQGRKSILLGVVPSGKVTYPEGPEEGSIEGGAPLDPDHSHFVLVETEEWGGETGMMFKVAKALAYKIPVVAILSNGGDISRKEVLSSVRNGWPLIVLEGTGGLADDIARNLREKTEKKQISENQMAEIIEEGEIRCFQLDGEVKELKYLIVKQLTINPTLKMAWERFALYDSNSGLQQRKANLLQKSTIFLGVIATFLAMTQAQLISDGKITPESMIYEAFRNIIILIPISISIIVAASKKFNEKNKWILLRVSAESIKRAIFCYRTQTGMNNETNDKIISPDVKLAKEIEYVSQQLMKTEVKLEGLKPYKGKNPPIMYYGSYGNDDGLSSLTPEDYITIRLDDQLNYYSHKSYRLDKRLKFYYWSIYILGGMGTYLAAIGFELWVAVTTSLAGAYISVLEFQKVEFSLAKYNKAATDISNVKVAWTVLSEDQKRKPENINKLVTDTEKILQEELEGWLEDAPAESKTKQEEGLNKSNQESSYE